MMNILFALLLMIFTPQTQVLTVKQTDTLSNVSVLIRSKQYTVEKDGIIRRGISGCSGTYIAGDRILTAAHCFSRPTTNIWVRGPDGVSHSAVVIKIDPDMDLALLLVWDMNNHAYAKLAKEIRIGQAVFNMGSPYMFEFLVSEGVISATNFLAKPFTGRYIITTAMINRGSSGGGAFNEKGELLGVNALTAGSMFGWAGISMAIDGDTIRRFLR